MSGRVVLGALLLILGVGPAWAGEGPMAPVLSVRIVPTDSDDGRRSISLPEPKSHFQVVVRNVSDRPQIVWKRLRWAWENLSFELRTESGGTVVIRRAPTIWTYNFPDPFQIDPGGSFVFDINLFDGSWLANGKPMNSENWPRFGKLRAIYSIPMEENAPRFHVWTGTVSSEFESYEFFVPADLSKQVGQRTAH